MAEVHGVCDDTFRSVRQALQDNLNSGEELGASIYVDIGGKKIIDLWGGYCDIEKTKPWLEDTIVNTWSVTKTITSLAALILVDRGLLELDTRVSKYWPEFAVNGKENVKVRHFLSHMSGVAGWDQPFDNTDMYDLEISTKRLAAQAPWWEPGTASGYHTTNFGHLIGELVRRTTGKTLRDFINEEIAIPLGADFQLGARKSDWDRVADLVPPPPFDIEKIKALGEDSPAVKSLLGAPVDALIALTPEFRQAQMGATNGHGNAHSVARILSVIARGGEIDGVRLVSPQTIDKIFEVQYDGVDLVLGVPLRWGTGFALPQPQTVPWIPEGNLCFWAGWGGSFAIVDVEKKLTFAYIMNKMGDSMMGNERTQQYAKAVFEAAQGITLDK